MATSFLRSFLKEFSNPYPSRWIVLLLSVMSTNISDERGKEVQLAIVDCDDVNSMRVILTGGNDCSVEAMAKCVFDCTWVHDWKHYDHRILL